MYNSFFSDVNILHMGMVEAPDQPKANKESLCLSHIHPKNLVACPILQALNSHAVATTGTHIP